MRFAIVGSRHYPYLDRVEAYVAGLRPGASIVTGSASGVDATAARAATARALPVQRVPASFEEIADPKRGRERNRRLISMCDVLVAFWDGESSGTRMTIESAIDAGKEVHVYPA
jgi:predicted Rossmann fold nucleotide-binding protein DprA/Smf involved in DNA uptake